MSTSKRDGDTLQESVWEFDFWPAPHRPGPAEHGMAVFPPDGERLHTVLTRVTRLNLHVCAVFSSTYCVGGGGVTDFSTTARWTASNTPKPKPYLSVVLLYY